jgi:hypothetical protein
MMKWCNPGELLPLSGITVMTQRILVRGELSNWVHAVRVLAALGLMVGVVLGLAGLVWCWIVAAGSGILWLILEGMAWQARRVRTWLTLHGDGIEVETRGGHRAIHDSQISAVALETKKNLNNGELSSVTRKFTLWVEDQPEPVRMENTIKTNRVDPLAGLIQRLLDRLKQRMEQDLARGGTASGEGWHLSRAALTVGRTPDDQQFPLGEVTAIESAGGQMCVWRRGSDTAVARLPLSARNVYLLPLVAQPYLPRTSEGAGSADSAGLGRALFERRPNRGVVITLCIAGIMMAAVGAALLATSIAKLNASEGALVAGLILFGLGPVLGFLGWWLAFTSFRCHERGVWKGSPLGQQTLRYTDVSSFQYSAVRHYHNGVYTGTHLSMRFRPITPDRGPAIKYNTTTHGDDDDLDNLRDVISRAIAVRMADQVHAQQTVRWTSNLQFLPTGISYRPSGLLGRKEPQLLPFADYGGYDLKQGVFYLFARGNKQYVTTEQASAENFYPGFFLLLMLLHQPTEAELVPE